MRILELKPRVSIRVLILKFSNDIETMTPKAKDQELREALQHFEELKQQVGYVGCFLLILKNQDY